MYFEKWGFMLIFWNMAGVPLSYCHCTLYLANHAPSVYHWNRYALAAFFVSYLFCYWVWDTCNSQKNRFRQQERGKLIERKAFPQLPWQTVKNPKMIKTKTGDSILVDGWCKSPLVHFSPETRRCADKKCRWLRTKNPLHHGSLLCSVMGLDHRISKSVPMVLSYFLRSDDHAPCAEGYPEMRREVW